MIRSALNVSLVASSDGEGEINILFVILHPLRLNMYSIRLLDVQRVNWAVF